MFEPIGGSAPKYTGKNIINPLAAVAAAQMMLEHLGEEKAAGRLEEAIRKVLLNDLKLVGVRWHCKTRRSSDIG